MSSIKLYLEALPCEEYVIQLVCFSDKKLLPIRKLLSQSQLLKSYRFLKFKNTQGYNIYCRPKSYQYILIDDIQREYLDQLALIKSSVLMETSPNNFQAFICLKNNPNTREEAQAICRELAGTFNADFGSAEPDHLGRLPGFTNRKEKYKIEYGYYPWVKLVGAKRRVSGFSPKGGIVLKNSTTEIHSRSRSEKDRSKEDFNLVCMLIRQGKKDDFIRLKLSEFSEKAKGRKDDYIERTIKNARITLNKTIS